MSESSIKIKRKIVSALKCDKNCKECDKYSEKCLQDLRDITTLLFKMIMKSKNIDEKSNDPNPLVS